MEQDPDITYSRFNKRFFFFLCTPLAIFRFRGRQYLYLFVFVFVFVFLSNCTVGLFWGTHFDPFSRASLLQPIKEATASPKQSH